MPTASRVRKRQPRTEGLAVAFLMVAWKQLRMLLPRRKQETGAARAASLIPNSKAAPTRPRPAGDLLFARPPAGVTRTPDTKNGHQMSVNPQSIQPWKSFVVAVRPQPEQTNSSKTVTRATPPQTGQRASRLRRFAAHGRINRHHTIASEMDRRPHVIAQSGFSGK
jgi:hypothetical protein